MATVTSVTRSRENTRARLMDAAYAVFAEVGLDAASVEAICERAGFTRGAFYSNFGSKDELFLTIATAMADRKLGKVADRVNDLRDSDVPPTTPGEIVQRVLDVTVEGEHAVILMSEIRLRAMRDDDTARAYRAWEQNMINRVDELITAVAETYGLRLRIPTREFARLMVMTWESSSANAVIDRLGFDDMCALAAKRAEQLAIALLEPNTHDLSRVKNA